jgi:hypothetical protein
MKKIVIAFLGFLSSGMSFGLTVDEFKCHLSLKDVKSGASLGSSSFVASPPRKQTFGLPPTTKSQIEADLRVGDISVNAKFDFYFQTGSGADMANFSDDSSLNWCLESKPPENSICNLSLVGSVSRPVAIKDGIPTFPESSLSAEDTIGNISVEVSCVHAQTYP